MGVYLEVCGEGGGGEVRVPMLEKGDEILGLKRKRKFGLLEW